MGRLVAIIRRERPLVVITYGDEQGGYPHPDHLRVHDITQPAVDAAADPAAYPEHGEPWQVSKIYYSVWSKRRIELTQRVDPETSGPGHITLTDPDGNQILIDQFF